MKEPNRAKQAGYVLYLDRQAGTAAFLQTVHLLLDLLVILTQSHSLPHPPTPRRSPPWRCSPSAEHYQASGSFLAWPKTGLLLDSLGSLLTKIRHRIVPILQIAPVVFLRNRER